MLRKKPEPTSKNLPSSSIFSDSSNARFFHEIEALSKALAVDRKNNSKNQRRLSLPLPSDPRPEPKPKPASSIWSWKPLKALSHIRHRRFDCTFSLHVHAIESLPPPLKSSVLVVHWKRASDPSSSSAARTRSAKAFHGSADFEETLTHRCSVYASRGGPHQPAKYEPRHFLIYVTLAGSTGFDFGKQRVELTRILPVTLEELLQGEKAEGEWSTSFRLAGRARGATLNVSFGYSIGNGSGAIGFQRSGSVRVEMPRASSRAVLGEVIKQELGADLELEAKVSPEKKCCSEENDCDEPEFTVIEQGVEIESRVKEAEVEKAKEGEEEQQEEEEPSLQNLNLEGLEVPRSDFEQGWPKYTKSRSLSLDHVADSVATEFLSMIGLENSSEGDPESPREKLWRQFEKESLINNGGIFGHEEVEPDLGLEDEDLLDDVDLDSIVRAAQMEQESINGKSRAQILEDAETEALMQEWGLDEKLFESSLSDIGAGFGSPIHLPPEEPPELPPLGENLGPFVQTKDGGFLRSMSPSLFASSKNRGSLVMQASSPVVVPAEMGSDVMEILQGLASVGMEKLSMQASKLMPLEDITGKTMQQVAWEAAPSLDSFQSQDMLQHLDLEALERTKKCRSSKFESSSSRESCSEYVSLEDLAPLAMDKIEALSIEGLKIQSGMSSEEAPLNISPQPAGEMPAFEGKGAKNRMSIGMEGAAGMHLMDVKDDGSDVDGLMGLSISLDEWMRLDSGVVDEEDEISERTTKVLAAHHAKSTDFHGDGKRGGKSRKWGLLGNNFTVALMVQLRDPLRNYEPVGTPMLALIQVERVFIPPKPKIYDIISGRGDNGQDDDDDEVVVKVDQVTKEEIKLEENTIPQFKISQVHVAGLKTEPSKKKLWGNQIQHQSGSRWLLANGMGKSSKHSFVKSDTLTKPSEATTKVQPGDKLWSISSRILGIGAKWKDLAALNPHRRNPNVILSSK